MTSNCHPPMLQFDQSTYVPDVETARIHDFLKKSYGITKAKLNPFTGYEDKNYRLDEIEYDGREGPTTLVLKISNPLEAATSGHLEFQVKLAKVLNNSGIPAPKTFPSLDGSQISVEEVALGVLLPVRLFHLLSGRILEEYDFTSELVQRIGAALGNFHKSVDESKLTTSHIPFISAENIAILRQEADLLHQLDYISTEKLLMIKKGYFQYEKLVENDGLDRGIIHSDFNETNILISNGQITGLLDFGDAHVAPRAMDIASLILYLQLSDRLQQGVSILAKNVLSGYRSVRPFVDSDEALLACMRARISCSLVYGLRTARIRGECSDGYVLKTQKPGWLLLEKLLARERLVNFGT